MSPAGGPQHQAAQMAVSFDVLPLDSGGTGRTARNNNVMHVKMPKVARAGLIIQNI
jgi:hypothetical protein